LQIKTWKTNPTYFVLLEILKKKGSILDSELFEELIKDFKDLGFKDFNEVLMRVEISGKIKISHMTRGKRRVEYIN
jgi:hypothetical protein